MKRGAPIVAEYLGGAVNCDAHHMTDPRADGLGVSSCIESCLEDAGVSPEEVTRTNFLFYYVLHFIFILFIACDCLNVFAGKLHQCPCNFNSCW